MRRILRLIAEDDRLQAEKLLVRGVAVEVDPETGLDAAAAAGAARADADSRHRLVAPREIDRIVLVAEKVDVQRLQVTAVDRETNIVEDRVVEEAVRGIDRRRLRDDRVRQQGAERQDEDERARPVQQHACPPALPPTARTAAGQSGSRARRRS